MIHQPPSCPSRLLPFTSTTLTHALTLSSAFTLLFVLIFVAVSPRVLAQNSRNEETLTNDSVVVMTKAGLSQAIIINQIRSSKTNFNLSTAELMRLKRERVADAVIEAMQQAAAPKAPAGTNGVHGSGDDGAGGASSASAASNVPMPEEPGIYLIAPGDSKSGLTQLEPSVYSQSKAGGFFGSAMTYGIKKFKIKAVLSVPNARLQINDRRPVFYFYFEHKSGGLSGYGSGIFGPTTSPNEFVLLKMDVKKNAREVIIGQGSMWGTQTGTMDKYAQAFDYEKLAPGVFKVTPRADLPPGEYCFAYASQIAAGFSKVFDFGIKGAY